MSNSLQPHELQYPRPPCSSPSPRVCLSSCSLHQWCHPAISSCDTLFSFSPRSFPGSETFPMSRLFASDDQNTYFSYLMSNIQKRRWHPTPVLLPRKPHGRRSLVGYSPWDREELDTTEQLHFHFPLSSIGEGNGNPLQCSCLENPRDRGSLVGCRLWGCTELDTTEAS